MKLLIVDDEERTRNMLCNHIDWTEVGIDRVESARNGAAALEQCRRFRPDIVLCDVRMPKMDGIVFAQRLREEDAFCRLLFLSGFSDKEYLMSAIRLHALDYLEKPINPDKVKEAVRAAVNSKTAEKKKKQEERRLKQTRDEGLPYLRQAMVRKLISSPESVHATKALESRETFLLPAESFYTVIASVLQGKASTDSDEINSIQDALLHKLNESILLNSMKGICGFDSRQFLIFILPGMFGSSYREKREVLEELYAEIHSIAGKQLHLSMGVGSSAQSRMEIPNAYRAALDAWSLHYYEPGRRLAFASELGTRQVAESNGNSARHLRELLKQGEWKAAQSFIENWTTRAAAFRNPDLGRLKDAYFQFLLVIEDVALQLGIADSEAPAERRDLWTEINRIPDLPSLEQYVLSWLDMFVLSGEEERSSAKVREILQYIHKHFHERGFMIRDIANQVGLSEAYLCSMFKKCRGSTVKEYISSLRMEHAKQLLMDQGLKLYEIADRTGFADANYFTTFFKKNAGCTPSEYRERNAK